MGNCLTCATFLSKESNTLPIENSFRGGFASGSIDLGGLEVLQISTFKKISAILEGGLDNVGATFLEPSPIPDGYSMLGCYAQPNNMSLFGWVLVGKDVENGTLEMPIDYTLVWCSKSLKFKKDGNSYIWLPTPPDGYSAVGLVVTDSCDKPPFDKVLCVRNDLVESCEQDMWIWGNGKDNNESEINFYGLKPSVRGTQAAGVLVGTFMIQMSETVKPPSLSCLKNVNFSSLSCMPKLTQIESLVQTYSPRIYLHPDEIYLPSSVNWFFENGALLYKKGDEPNPVPIQPEGSNLPQGGSNDGEYWLDLPQGDSRDEVKKGDLQSSVAYLHVKPMLGGTFTDIAIWIFYPFNGPATAKVQLIDLPLGIIGEHVGDWEHVTLRISNFTGQLRRVYFSQHSRGTWLDASEVEFENGNNVVAYASLNGHAFYPTPGLVLQGNSTLRIGIRNDTAKSSTVMDVSSRYEIVSAEYLGTVIEPPWLNYARDWGPKISYDLANQLKSIENSLPEGVKSSFENVINVLPSEVLGEEGPTGPKMKKNWSGDEI
ncbi:hypothetical protein ACHQM5_019339 [Ranunculus cassubicifolius]